MELRYYKKMKYNGRLREVSYKEALNSVLGTFRDNDMSRDMLTIPNSIDCRYAWIYVKDYSTNPPKVLMAGLWNQLPAFVEYDDDGNHI